ncbi:hypothetical protein AGABI1DRAFT_86972 [Agaricus bisporus var. burnettii JB137-S8]|uniref:Uncharacterized protein n=1 Tax=Agaricus bisporus var. burnettii (strain JB137-S8 / ATCC MYA-4627 / FGSC 10392) TaxID=597362 RepID=K5XQ93_AGABU|nr:uncharacterized protein AGABI1DRAFT_86972 [Agaricus bisporus var. burnettii JB137-S8]EKM76950.1 hypothetical protein AGABI1DRAFT_86972 [Agaricus bisporus var. burnettii JB137-S8]
MPWGEETKACDESPDSVEVSNEMVFCLRVRGDKREDWQCLNDLDELWMDCDWCT